MLFWLDEHTDLGRVIKVRLFVQGKKKRNQKCDLCVLCKELQSSQSQVKSKRKKKIVGKIDKIYQQAFAIQEALFKTQTRASMHTHNILLLIFQICYFFNLKQMFQICYQYKKNSNKNKLVKSSLCSCVLKNHITNKCMIPVSLALQLTRL